MEEERKITAFAPPPPKKEISFGDFSLPVLGNKNLSSSLSGAVSSLSSGATTKDSDGNLINNNGCNNCNSLDSSAKASEGQKEKKTNKEKIFSLSDSELTEEDKKIDERTKRGEVVGFVSNVDIAALVDQVIGDAVRSRTSDIHIEPFEKFLGIKLRIDGEFYEYRNFDIEYAKLILTRIQVLAGLKIDQLRVPQDGKINMGIIDGKRIDLRVSTLPVIYGNKIVIRILEKDNQIKTLADLGYNHHAIKKINRNLERTYGMVLMSGPTGSGKSTTLFAMLSKYDPFKYNISTLEDPVEYFFEGVNQSQINVDAGFDFSDGLRSLVRQDPDIIMLGEVRDNITTKLSIQSAITGHLVFSTVHANSAATTVQRLMNMGADPFLVASALNVVVSQRLVRKVCPHCAQKYTPTKSQLNSISGVLKHLKEGEEPNFQKGVGCEQCNGSGYHGRLAIYEVLEITPKIEKIITETKGVAQDIEEAAIKDGMVTIKENGILEAMRGKTTLEEVLIAVDDQGINNDVPE